MLLAHINITVVTQKQVSHLEFVVFYSWKLEFLPKTRILHRKRVNVVNIFGTLQTVDTFDNWNF